MKILLVDDNRKHVSNLLDVLHSRGLSVDVAEAGSRTQALGLLSAHQFDLLVCDLEIPPDAGLSAEVDHGMAVIHQAQSLRPGVPILVLSGQGGIPIVKELYESSPHADFVGKDTDQPLLTFFEKDKLPECVDWIAAYDQALAALARIELSAPIDLQLSELQKRTLRIFARRNKGGIVTVEARDEGMSAAMTVHIVVIEHEGNPVHRAIAKIDRVDAIDSELQSYQKTIRSGLAAGTYANLIDQVIAGAGEWGCLIYAVAPSSESLFEVLGRDQDLALTSLARLRERLAPWTEGVSTRECQIGDVRRFFLSDDDYQLKVLPRLEAGFIRRIESIEERTIHIRPCRQHGDMHGTNVLVEPSGHPMLIDYARAGTLGACVDPITLEMSLLFHPRGREVCEFWPSEEQAAQWVNLETYAIGCPVEAFIRGCRGWSEHVKTGNLELWATAYGFVLRQFRFPDCDESLCFALINGLFEAIDAA